MGLEHLNKTQIILLTTLVAFVSSIATSIVTVTLMDQAPPGTNTTIRSVVERTVERVVQASAPKETVKTVIVREEDTIAEAVDKQSKAIVRIFVATAVSTAPSDTAAAAAALAVAGSEFVALGFVVSEDGVIVTDSALVAEDVTYMIKLSDGTTFDAKAAFQDEERHVAFLKPVKPLEKKIIVANIGDSDTARLGGLAVVIGGKEQTVVNTGVVSAFDVAKKTVEIDGEKSEVEYRSGIRLSINTNAGDVILSGQGTIIAMGIGPDAKTPAVPVNIIKELLATFPKE